MAKKEEIEFNNTDLGVLDDSMDFPMKEVPKPIVAERAKTPKTEPRRVEKSDNTELVNPLRNERIIVRYLPKRTGIWGNNPKHVLAGGMAETASRFFVVPKLSSGMYVNVLTDSEKAYLEEIMGLEYNALSIYRKTDNFWDDSNDKGISRVRLNKGDNYLDLSIPEDYIKYKILLANKDFICPSLQTYEDYPKATYQFVLVQEGEESKLAKNNMSVTMQCYMEYGKVETDIDILRTIIETIEGRPTAKGTKLEFLQTKVNNLIQSDGKMFLRTITDPLLSTKVLIKKAIENNIIANRGGFLYLRENNTPLCEDGEDPTLNIAARYLNQPKRQELKFSIEAKIKG